MTDYRFHPDALAEATEAVTFYEMRQPGLGKRFIAALRDAAERVCRNPSLYREVDVGIRKCRLLRFPYGVIFRVRDRGIEIIAVMHLRREPGYWKSRT
jgi:toxin ParE1/3/4